MLAMNSESGSRDTNKDKKTKAINKLFKAVRLLANVDNITPMFKLLFVDVLTASSTSATTEIFGSGVATLLMAVTIFYAVSSGKARKLPFLWLSLITLSNVLSIVGGSIQLSQTYIKNQNNCTDTTNIPSGVLIGASKLIHPLGTNLLEVFDDNAFKLQ